ncbi:MAG TPA: Xaa-Pro peptidase family protein [Anaerolineales bacterium]
MSNKLFFPQDEFESRVQNVRKSMAERGLAACLISSPENIYYLTGLDHLGYFAYHILIVPKEGNNILIARAMEHVTIETFVKNARFAGYADSTDQAGFTCNVLEEAGLSSGNLGIEKNTLFLPPVITEGITSTLPEAKLVDISGLVDGFRRTKSSRELDYTRQAARVADAMMHAAIETARAGVNEKEVAAQVYRAMVTAGGEYPGFGPFIRSTPRLGQEHRTWEDRVLQPGDALFIELAGCVRRYHAAMGRLIFIETAPEGTQAISELCLRAFGNVVASIRPGIKAREVYQSWQEIVDQAGLSHYRRHHCGYMIGIGMPPSWIGGNMVVGLRHDSDLELKQGMGFHLMSWLMDTGRPGDYFVSDTAVVTENGCEVITTVPQTVHVV